MNKSISLVLSLYLISIDDSIWSIIIRGSRCVQYYVHWVVLSIGASPEVIRVLKFLRFPYSIGEKLFSWHWEGNGCQSRHNNILFLLGCFSKVHVYFLYFCRKCKVQDEQLLLYRMFNVGICLRWHDNMFVWTKLILPISSLAIYETQSSWVLMYCLRAK